MNVREIHKSMSSKQAGSTGKVKSDSTLFATHVQTAIQKIENFCRQTHRDTQSQATLTNLAKNFPYKAQAFTMIYDYYSRNQGLETGTVHAIYTAIPSDVEVKHSQFVARAHNALRVCEALHGIRNEMKKNKSFISFFDGYQDDDLKEYGWLNNLTRKNQLWEYNYYFYPILTLMMQVPCKIIIDEVKAAQIADILMAFISYNMLMLNLDAESLRQLTTLFEILIHYPFKIDEVVSLVNHMPQEDKLTIHVTDHMTNKAFPGLSSQGIDESSQTFQRAYDAVASICRKISGHVVDKINCAEFMKATRSPDSQVMKVLRNNDLADKNAFPMIFSFLYTLPSEQNKQKGAKLVNEEVVENFRQIKPT